MFYFIFIYFLNNQIKCFSSEIMFCVSGYQMKA